MTIKHLQFLNDNIGKIVFSETYKKGILVKDHKHALELFELKTIYTDENKKNLYNYKDKYQNLIFLK